MNTHTPYQFLPTNPWLFQFGLTKSGLCCQLMVTLFNTRLCWECTFQAFCGSKEFAECCTVTQNQQLIKHVYEQIATDRNQTNKSQPKLLSTINLLKYQTHWQEVINSRRVYRHFQTGIRKAKECWAHCVYVCLCVYVRDENVVC